MKKLLMFLIVLVVLGYAGYKLAIGFLSDKMIDQVAVEVLNEDEVDELLDDPEVKKLVEQNVDEFTAEDLPFHTKEEALKTVTKKFSISELNELKDKIAGGMDSQELEELKATLEEKLSPEEMEALKIIALKELQKRQ